MLHYWLTSDNFSHYSTSVSYQKITELFGKVCEQLLQTLAKYACCIFQGQNLNLNIYITLQCNIY